MAIRTAVTITTINPFMNLIANAAGKTKRAETKRTPIIGIITEIAKPTGRWKYLILWFIKSKSVVIVKLKLF